MDVKVLKVSGGTEIHSLAGSILSVMEEGKEPQLAAIGPHAVNQAIKAIAIAVGMSSRHGWYLAVRPSFSNIETDKGSVSGIILACEWGDL